MSVEYEAVIGLEVHAEMQTDSKMFCSCRVLDNTEAQPNSAVCPVCAGMPGVLPVINQKAIEYALKVALALHCQVNRTSIFARKNYFYPDLPKGYQISQYEEPLAENGHLVIHTSLGERRIRIRRAHMEEDTGKLTHTTRDEVSYSLVNLNRAGVALLEVVSEPDMSSSEEARAYAASLRAVLRCLGVNSGDMEKGVIRFEANVSIRPQGSDELNTRVEIKNLNSFRALERSIDYEIKRQTQVVENGGKIIQETLGWDENRNVTYSQRSKEHAHDYRYFPEPDLPPLIVENEWVERLRASMPELPDARARRFQSQYGLSPYDADVLITEQAVADYYEAVIASAPKASPKTIANWITGELFALMNRSGTNPDEMQSSAFNVPPQALAGLINLLTENEINQNTAKTVLTEMFESGKTPGDIVIQRGLRQISDSDLIASLVKQVLDENAVPVQDYLNGKDTLLNWLFGQIMRAAKGKANPQILRAELDQQIDL
ncbi:MAG: Asp-tRNA(Asn)/Glu-tRNA(Gln) amidotransferase subunit GatB, partial [Chloroflexota bacterium]